MTVVARKALVDRLNDLAKFLRQQNRTIAAADVATAVRLLQIHCPDEVSRRFKTTAGADVERIMSGRG